MVRKRNGKSEKTEKRKFKTADKISFLGNADIFVVRKSYKTKKAQDLVGLVLFCCYILWFAHLVEYLNLGAAF